MLPLSVCSFELVVHRRKKSTNYMLPTTHFKVKHGFTLIELLIVISIIALLVAAATVSWRNAQEKGRDGKRKTDLKAIQQSLETYLQTNGKYPSSAGGQIACNVVGDTHTVLWNAKFSCTPSGGGEIIYMQQLPQDSVYQSDTNSGYYYSSSAPNLTYVLSADLENINDPDRVIGGVPCTPQGSRDYCVINP